MQDPTEPVCCACKQEADAGESELEGLEAVLDSCFMPALEHIDRGTSAVEALDALVVDLLSLAQSSSREREKAFAVESLESLQRQCPMSMAVATAGRYTWVKLHTLHDKRGASSRCMLWVWQLREGGRLTYCWWGSWGRWPGYPAIGNGGISFSGSHICHTWLTAALWEE